MHLITERGIQELAQCRKRDILHEDGIPSIVPFKKTQPVSTTTPVAKELNLPPGDYDYGKAYIVIRNLDINEKEMMFRVVYQEPFSSLDILLLNVTSL